LDPASVPLLRGLLLGAALLLLASLAALVYMAWRFLWKPGRTGLAQG
jgi:hypothetical protein